MRVVRAQVGGFILALLLFAQRADACSIFPLEIRAGRSFLLSVTDRGKTVSGLQIFLHPVVMEPGRAFPRSGARISATTDTNGRARFQDVEAGSYYVSTLAGGDPHVVVAIDPSIRTTQEFKYHWPALRVLSTKTLAGELLIDNQTPLEIALVHPLSGKTIAKTLLTGGGLFSFPQAAPGLYFLDVHETKEQDFGGSFDGKIAVQVDENSAAQHLTIGGVATSCGLMYAESCLGRPIQIPALRGVLVDESGGVIGQAPLVATLRGQPSKVVSTTTNSDGSFDLASGTTGAYDLRISGTGFPPAYVPVVVQPDRRVSQRFRVVMSIGSSCTGKVTRD